MENRLFEQSDLINNPVECFYYDSVNHNFPIRPHFHYYMEIVLMLKGTATMHCNTKVITVKEGEMILFHPNAVHAIYSADDNPVYYAVFKLDVYRMNLTSKYSPKLRSIFKGIEKKDMDVVFPREFVEEHKVNELFEKCIKEYHGKSYGYDMYILANIYSLLIDIIRYYQSKGFSFDSDIFAEDGRYDVFSITNFITENIGSDLKVTDIADKCGMSYSYFAKKFQSVYQKSCKEYIEELRMYRAEDLLVFTDFDLNYIAQECGYSDCSHLIKCFKKYRGVTPKKYRMLHLEKKADK